LPAAQAVLQSQRVRPAVFAADSGEDLAWSIPEDRYPLY